MSGTIGSNILSHSGIVAETAAGLNWVSDVVTASTVTVESGNGYWINTTSNACTITLPASAEAGDNIVIVDFARTWGTNSVTLDSNGLNFQGNADTYTVEYTTSGQSVNLIFSDSTKGWIPLEDDVVAEAPTPPPTQRAIFGFGGASSGNTAITNLVGSNGVVGANVTGVGTVRNGLAAAGYGSDKAIFGFGNTGSATGKTNLVNNSGVVAADVSAVGTARYGIAAANYGTDKAIFGYGNIDGTGSVSMTNLVNTSGVVGSDVTGVGTARHYAAGVGYGSTGQAIFGYGTTAPLRSTTNLVTNQGVVGSDVSGVGTARSGIGAASYGGDKAIFAYGYTGSNTAISNLVNNQGVVGSNVSGVGSVRDITAAASFGGDKAIFGYGVHSGTNLNVSNLVSNQGVVASDVSGVGLARQGLAAAGYSTSA